MGGSSANRLTSPINGDTLGAAGGAEGHQLTEAELAAHDHLMFRRESVGGREINDLTEAEGAQRAISAKASYANDTAYSMAHSDLNNVANVGLTAPAGSGNSHNNVQPTIILNYIIKT
jgi:microcystin-dependent protein